MGSFICGKSVVEMEWMKTLILQSETDMTLRGDIYAGSYKGEVIFIHQPMIMSCLACVIYDCDGNQLSTATMDHEEIILNMAPRNRIYSPL